MQAPRGPILASEALARRAVTRAELRRDYVGIYPGVWVPRESQRTARQRLRRVAVVAPPRVLAGVSASAMLGAKWIDGDAPAELVHSNRRAPPLLTVHTDTLLPGEVQMVRGLPVTTAARTAFDLGRRLPTTEGVQRVDALMNATDLKVVDIAAVADAHRAPEGCGSSIPRCGLSTTGPNRRMSRSPGCDSYKPVSRYHRLKYRCTTPRATSALASTWVGRNTSSAPTSRAPTIGLTPSSGNVTRSVTTSSPRPAGSTSG